MKILATRKPMFKFGKLLEGPYRSRETHLPWGLIVTGLTLAAFTKLLF